MEHSPYRIGIDAQAIGTNFSGNEVYIKNVIKNLDRSSRFDYRLFVNKNFNYAGDFTGTDWKLLEFKTRSPFIRLPFEFPGLIRREKLDLLHVQYTAPYFADCPIVSTIHDISFEHYPEFFTKKEASLLKVGIRKTAKEAAKIITVSEYSKQDMIDTYGVPAEKIVVTYNSIDEAFLDLTGIDRVVSYEPFGRQAIWLKVESPDGYSSTTNSLEVISMLLLIIRGQLPTELSPNRAF